MLSPNLPPPLPLKTILPPSVTHTPWRKRYRLSKISPETIHCIYSTEPNTQGFNLSPHCSQCQHGRVFHIALCLRARVLVVGGATYVRATPCRIRLCFGVLSVPFLSLYLALLTLIGIVLWSEESDYKATKTKWLLFGSEVAGFWTFLQSTLHTCVVPLHCLPPSFSLTKMQTTVAGMKASRLPEELKQKLPRHVHKQEIERIYKIGTIRKCF